MESKEESGGPPGAQQVVDLHLATGLGVMKAKAFLEAESAERCERILRAFREQRRHEQGGSLHDPIEDEPVFRERVEAAKAAALEEHRVLVEGENRKLVEEGLGRLAEEWPRGSCHRIWRLMKERLEQQGILWYSPAEMNPCAVFD
ncbi:MAG: hypothetical protein JWO82_1819 [Akkermansiaceae bacterium]|nr:hypothetical protein [Akkermansiaceae bacterium]